MAKGENAEKQGWVKDLWGRGVASGWPKSAWAKMFQRRHTRRTEKQKLKKENTDETR